MDVEVERGGAGASIGEGQRGGPAPTARAGGLSAGRTRAGRGSAGAVIAMWGAAIGLAWLATAILFLKRPGVNLGIWVTLAAAGFVWSATRGGRRLDPVAAWAIGLGVLVSWGAAVTANMMFEFFIYVSCAVLAATATRVAGGVRGTRIGVPQMAGAPLIAGVYAVFETGQRGIEALMSMSGLRGRPVVRGLVIAIPISLVFAAILAGADPTLTQWRDMVGRLIAELNIGPMTFFFVGVTIIVLGSYGIAMRGTQWEKARLALEAPPAWRIGETERAVVVAAVAGVFGAFLAVQASYLFRNTGALRVSGMSYTDYAHRGFTELTIAATMCVGLVLTLDRHTRADSPSQRPEPAARWGYWGTLLLIAEVLVVLASAFYRVSVYETTFGYTELRIYVQAYVVGVAIALLLLGAEVAGIEGGFDARRVARRVGATAMLFLAAFSFGNPEGWVVAGNMARFRATGKLDASYLTALSLNAVPSVIAVLPELPPRCAEQIRGHYREMWDNVNDPRLRMGRKHWFEWNWRRDRAAEAIRSQLGAIEGASEFTPGECGARDARG